MADEAVTPAGGRTERRGGGESDGPAWVRAVDADVAASARWIEDEGDGETAEVPRRPEESKPGAGQPPG